MPTRANIMRSAAQFVGRRVLKIARTFGKIKLVRADGAAAATNITLADADGRSIGADATILGCIEVTANTAALVDHTEEASMASEGNLQLSTTATTGDDLLVLVIDWDDNQIE